MLLRSRQAEDLDSPFKLKTFVYVKKAGCHRSELDGKKLGHGQEVEIGLLIRMLYSS